jgi:hypothetical protein
MDPICPSSEKPCVAHLVCEERHLCARARFAPIDMIGEDYKPLVHFVGFRGEEYWSAVRVWGLPDVYHRSWDMRALREIAKCDTVVFAKGDPAKPSPFSYDDSNESDDPAARERLSSMAERRNLTPQTGVRFPAPLPRR